MTELNFCPFCDASQHKILGCKGDTFFCKECHRFFKLKEFSLKCPKCEKDKIVKSDFPAPNGEALFQCFSCKHMLPASKFFKANNIK